MTTSPQVTEGDRERAIKIRDAIYEYHGLTTADIPAHVVETMLASELAAVRDAAYGVTRVLWSGAVCGELGIEPIPDGEGGVDWVQRVIQPALAAAKREGEIAEHKKICTLCRSHAGPCYRIKQLEEMR